jgi:hypothetical protein
VLHESVTDGAARVDPRIGQIVGQLDRLVSVEGADVLVVVDAFWQTYPHIDRHSHDALFLATPAGYLRFGIEFLKTAVSPAKGKGQNGNKVPLELDYMLRQDSDLSLECELIGRDPTRRPVGPPGAESSGWEVAGPPAGREVMALLRELDRLVPAVHAEILITVPEDLFPRFPMRGTREGFLRFGLEFAKGSVIPGSRKGRNRGEAVVLDLDYLFARETELMFNCERIAALPERGDRRRRDIGMRPEEQEPPPGPSARECWAVRAC